MSSFNVKWPKIVLFGDSLTQRSFDEEGAWGRMLASTFQRKADVLNRGFSGYNTRWSRQLIEQIFDSIDFKQVACVVICFGANDSWIGDKQVHSTQYVPLDEFDRNLTFIIRWLEEKGLKSEQIVLCTPPTFVLEDWAKFRDFSTQGKSNECLREYVEAIRQVKEKSNVSFADVHQAFEQKSTENDERTFFVDGLHLSHKGATIFYQTVEPVVSELVQKWRQTDSLNFPLWTEFK